MTRQQAIEYLQNEVSDTEPVFVLAAHQKAAGDALKTFAEGSEWNGMGLDDRVKFANGVQRDFWEWQRLNPNSLRVDPVS